MIVSYFAITRNDLDGIKYDGMQVSNTFLRGEIL
jgi:hypothetical protein